MRKWGLRVLKGVAFKLHSNQGFLIANIFFLGCAISFLGFACVNWGWRHVFELVLPLFLVFLLDTFNLTKMIKVTLPFCLVKLLLESHREGSAPRGLTALTFRTCQYSLKIFYPTGERFKKFSMNPAWYSKAVTFIRLFFFFPQFQLDLIQMTWVICQKIPRSLFTDQSGDTLCLTHSRQ